MKKSIFLITFNGEIFMVPIYALLIGLVGVSLCMANISGIVTDTGTTPIPGVVVQLEKGGQKDTTEANGSFSLVIGTTGILPGESKLLQNGLSARISGNLMTVTLAKRAVVAIATFDLGGKALSTMRKTLDAGCRSIELPYHGAGVYLYKVKSGNSEVVLKGNSIGGISSGSSVTTQGSSSNPLAKQALSTAAINDVIAATKTGYLHYQCVQHNDDTSGVAIKMIANAGDMTDIDGNVYQTVRIGTQVWMAENLRVTRYNDGSAIPLDTSTATWRNAATPRYCFYNNTTNPDSIKKYGVLYNWHVVSLYNFSIVAPAGWHVPTSLEIATLQNYLIANGYNWDVTTTGNKIAKSLAAKTDWLTDATTGTTGCDLTKNNRSGFSAIPGGYRYSNGTFYDQSMVGVWWCSTPRDAYTAGNFYIGYATEYLDGLHDFSACGFSVRLLRD